MGAKLLEIIFLEQTMLPIISINTNGELILWSKGAEELFGYTKEEVIINKHNFLTSESNKEFSLMLKKLSDNENFIYKTKQEHKKGFPINLVVNASPVYNEEKKICAIFAIFQNSSKLKKAASLNPSLTQKDSKRTFKVIRNTILSHLTKGKMTINQISNSTNINWKTVEKHLTYLIGKKMIEEVFSSEYVRIFELAERGRSYITNTQKEKLTDFFKIENS